jgi:hypothetical protein
MNIEKSTVALLIALALCGGCELDGESNKSAAGDTLTEGSEQNTSIDANTDTDVTIEVVADSGGTVNININEAAEKEAEIEELGKRIDRGLVD